MKPTRTRHGPVDWLLRNGHAVHRDAAINCSQAKRGAVITFSWTYDNHRRMAVSFSGVTPTERAEVLTMFLNGDFHPKPEGFGMNPSSPNTPAGTLVGAPAAQANQVRLPPAGVARKGGLETGKVDTPALSSLRREMWIVIIGAASLGYAAADLAIRAAEYFWGWP